MVRLEALDHRLDHGGRRAVGDPEAELASPVVLGDRARRDVEGRVPVEGLRVEDAVGRGRVRTRYPPSDVGARAALWLRADG
jgi:hypothetical protein